MLLNYNNITSLGEHTFIVLNVLVVSYPAHFHKIILGLLCQVEGISFVEMYYHYPCEHFVVTFYVVFIDYILM